LQLCIEDKQLPIEVRIAAVEAHRYRKLLAYFCPFVHLSTAIKVLIQLLLSQVVFITDLKMIRKAHFKLEYSHF
jgi:hypothetical protein